MAIQQNLFVDAGTDFSAVFTLYSDNGVTPLDITGFTIKAQMRKSYMSSTAITFVCAVLVPGTNGQFSISLPESTTTDIKAGRYLYDVEMLDLSNNKTRPVEGIVTVSPQITQV